MKIRTDFVTNSSSSSFITVTIKTKKKDYTANVYCDDLDYPCNGLFYAEEPGILDENLSNINELLDNLYEAYNGTYTCCDIMQGLEQTELMEVTDFSEVVEIIVEEKVSGDVSYEELETAAFWGTVNVDPNSSMKIVESYNPETKEHTLKKYVEDEDGEYIEYVSPDGDGMFDWDDEEEEE